MDHLIITKGKKGERGEKRERERERREREELPSPLLNSGPSTHPS